MEKSLAGAMLTALKHATRRDHPYRIATADYRHIQSLFKVVVDPGPDSLLQDTDERSVVRWNILTKWSHTRRYLPDREYLFIVILRNDPAIAQFMNGTI